METVAILKLNFEYLDSSHTISKTITADWMDLYRQVYPMHTIDIMLDQFKICIIPQLISAVGILPKSNCTENNDFSAKFLTEVDFLFKKFTYRHHISNYLMDQDKMEILLDRHYTSVFGIHKHRKNIEKFLFKEETLLLGEL